MHGSSRAFWPCILCKVSSAESLDPASCKDHMEQVQSLLVTVLSTLRAEMAYLNTRPAASLVDV